MRNIDPAIPASVAEAVEMLRRSVVSADATIEAHRREVAEWGGVTDEESGVVFYNLMSEVRNSLFDPAHPFDELWRCEARAFIEFCESAIRSPNQTVREAVMIRVAHKLRFIEDALGKAEIPLGPEMVRVSELT